ncbi:TIGR04255 family protein [Echinicola sp. CAU 1574]|uniref:TIGR04255 family protein n=1 Tax=Echinicola arenosa TaxID=2774144 RepID=A0ABR9AMZ5_9BACT|nr:TIGR04255 family protein [Echinicola arenosa]MBD8490075.1 TIGR04255 family protein [Echinicola arenosa]
MNKLANAPLQEVIFEVRWELSPDSSGKQMIDAGFPFALGKFQDFIKGEFPLKISKVPTEIPSQMMGYQTMYQFWKGNKTWPVIQFGPGILTVNDTEKNYIWEDNYYPLIKETIGFLLKAYEQKINFVGCTLRYVDVVEVEKYGHESWESFVKKHINIAFENKFNTRGELENFRFDQSFKVNNLGTLNVNMSSGQNNKKKPLFIWQTGLSRSGRTDFTELVEWLEKAHTCASNVFKELCKKDFYGSFS